MDEWAKGVIVGFVLGLLTPFVVAWLIAEPLH